MPHFRAIEKVTKQYHHTSRKNSTWNLFKSLWKRSTRAGNLCVLTGNLNDQLKWVSEKKQLLQNPLNVIISGTQTSWEKETTAKKHLFTTSTSTARKILENSVNFTFYTSRFTLWFLETYPSNLLVGARAPSSRPSYGCRPRSRRDQDQRQGISHQFSLLFRDQMIPIFLPLSSVIWKSIWGPHSP